MQAPKQRRKSTAQTLRRTALALVAVAVAGALVYAFLPAPIPVDLASATRGPLAVTVRNEGKTRIKDRYIVSSPLAGRVLRIQLNPGDDVVVGRTVLAVVEPADPSLLDARALAQTRANVKAAEAARLRAAAELERTVAALERAQSHFRKVKTLRETGSASSDELEDAELLLRQSTQQHEAAKFNVNIADFELEQAKAALLRFEPKPDDDHGGDVEDGWRMEVRSPITGQILRVFQQSAAVVAAGAPLVEVGDPKDLEVVVDVLSTDAVRIRPGNPVRLEHWGGGRTLDGRVRMVEPQAFTKISALGVEEQRVNVVVDFTSPREERDALGDGYRVEADIVVWQSDNVLKVPVSALFRRGDQWVVFVAKNGRAQVREIELGERNDLEASVQKGLGEGELVVVHPSDEIQDGGRIRSR
jgi:HlyD family secretion protein